MKLLLRPVDTFTFRDHRDFNAGEDSVGFTFPFPTPTTLYGALRSAYIYRHSNFEIFAQGGDEKVKEWMGTPSEYGKFQVQGTFIEHQGTLYLPVPLDVQIIVEENKDTGEVREYARTLQLIKERPRASDGKNYRLIASNDQKSTSAMGRYVSLIDYQRLIYEQRIVPVYCLNQWIAMEEKTGIMSDKSTNRQVEHMLYQLPMYRFIEAQNTVFATYIDEGPSFAETKLARVGRKGRPWIIESTEDELTILTESYREQIKQEIRQSGIAKLIFLTPTIFNQGTTSLLEGNQRLKISNDLELEVLTLATDRPEVIGGYDFVKKRAKPRRNVVTAGTVVYVKVPEDKIELFLDTMQLHRLTDDLTCEGYGLCTCSSGQITPREEL